MTVSGELGSGKTTFVRGAARGARRDRAGHEPDLHDRPSVPWLGRRVRTSTSTVSQGVSAAEWGDLEPYFDGAVCFVEWPEAAAGDCSRAPALRVRLGHVDETDGAIAIERC